MSVATTASSFCPCVLKAGKMFEWWSQPPSYSVMNGTPGLDQPARQQGPLAQRRPAERVANLVGLSMNFESALRGGRGHQRHGLLVVFVGAQHRITRGTVVEPGELVQPLAHFPAVRGAPVVELAGDRDVADRERLLVRVIGHHERCVTSPQEVGPPRAGHAGKRKVGGQTVGRAALGRDHRPHAGMKADEGAAAHGNSRGGPGHHVVVAGAHGCSDCGTPSGGSSACR